MADVMKVLRDEIARLARKEMKAPLTEMKKDNARLRKQLAALRIELQKVSRVSSTVVRAAKKSGIVAESPLAGAAQKQDAADAKVRFSGATIRKMRAKLGLTQTEFATLANVSGQSVFQWEHAEGQLRLRSATKAALAAMRGLGKREALALLESTATKAPKAAKAPKVAKATKATKATKTPKVSKAKKAKSVKKGPKAAK